MKRVFNLLAMGLILFFWFGVLVSLIAPLPGKLNGFLPVCGVIVALLHWLQHDQGSLQTLLRGHQSRICHCADLWCVWHGRHSSAPARDRQRRPARQSLGQTIKEKGTAVAVP